MDMDAHLLDGWFLFSFAAVSGWLAAVASSIVSLRARALGAAGSFLARSLSREYCF